MLLITWRLDDLNLLLKQFGITVIYLPWRHTKGKLHACRIGKLPSIIGTSAFAQGQQNGTDAHLDPIFPIPGNRETQCFVIEPFHLWDILTEQHNIIEIM